MQVPWILAPADHLSDPTRATEGIDWIEKTAIIRNGLKQMNRPHHLFFVCFSKTNTKNGLAAGLISELIIFTGGSGNKRNGFCQKLSAEKEQTILHFSMLPLVYSWTRSDHHHICHCGFANSVAGWACEAASLHFSGGEFTLDSAWDSTEGVPAPQPRIISSGKCLQSSPVQINTAGSAQVSPRGFGCAGGSQL